MKDLSNYRKSYSKKELLEEKVPDNPMELFQEWFYDAEQDPLVSEANAMGISTIGEDGFPKNRIVLLKKFTWEGFIFYTNYLSEKGKAITFNSNVCLSFFWPGLERQVIIKGKAKKVSNNSSDGYFETRPDGSKLGAWASMQSSVVSSKKYLEDELDKFTNKFKDQEIPRPSHWGGYIVVPQSIEFWQGRPNRMHDRIRYSSTEDFLWIKERLAP